MSRYLNNLWAPVLWDKEGGSGGSEDSSDDLPAKKAETAETFSKEYVRELRAENKGYRLKYQEAAQKAKAEEDARKAAEEALAKAQDEANKKAEQRIIRAELKAEALKLGMIDLDGLSFLDYSSIRFDDKGELKGGAEALAKLKEAKPYLFGEVSKTSTGHKAPDKKPNEPVDARKLSPQEYAALKASLGLR